MAKKLTPMMQQYWEAKERYPDALLFFRMGDFYELFFQDAEVAARQLQIALTSRGKSEENEIPMAGVPHHSAQGYISQLLDKGFSVAICEQLEPPSATTGLVKRDVVRVITPGVILDTEGLDVSTHNYVAALFAEEGGSTPCFGVAYLDVSTGTFQCTSVTHINDAISEITRVEPRELLMNELAKRHLNQGDRRISECSIRVLDKEKFTLNALKKEIKNAEVFNAGVTQNSYFHTYDSLQQQLLSALEKGKLRASKLVESTVYGILRYVAETQRGIPSHISSLYPYESTAFLVIDESTRANLELTQTLMGGNKKGSLLSVLDKTSTPLGARCLRHWLSYPLIDPTEINARHDAVEELFKNPAIIQDIGKALKEVFDLERLCGRITSGTSNARDLKNLERTLQALPLLSDLLQGLHSSIWKDILDQFDPYEPLRTELSNAIVDDPPTTITEGGIFKKGYKTELDEIIDLSQDGKRWMLDYEAKLKEETLISSLKIRFNKVFGYFIEVTNANLHLVPDTFIRKQTLSNCERYFTAELKEQEEKVLHAKENRQKLELELFQSLRATTSEWISHLLETSRRLATVDVLASFATIAKKYDYRRPIIDESGKINIQEGRHPVVEHNLQEGRFVPNDVTIDTENKYLQIITGPNMSGKSTVIRQVALIVIMAQMGSFVPANSAEIGIVDKVFSRVGASDNLARGESTFMVEMSEAAHILKNATQRSLIILDEIGRGTSTFDGLSIAWAVVEYIHNSIAARTMFATHYHELTELMHILNGVINMSIAALEHEEEIVFLRKLVEGAADRSYGIQVGQLAGLPESVISRAKEILQSLESNQFNEKEIPIPKNKQGVSSYFEGQGTLFPTFATPSGPSPEQTKLIREAEQLIDAIKSININTMTPLDALNFLQTLTSKVNNQEEA